jgi:hypothetical protein
LVVEDRDMMQLVHVVELCSQLYTQERSSFGVYG